MPLTSLEPRSPQLEQIAEKFSRAGTYDDGVWLGYSLQARCQIWRFADDTSLLCLARSDQIAGALPEPTPDAQGLDGVRFSYVSMFPVEQCDANHRIAGSGSCSAGERLWTGSPLKRPFDSAV